MVRGVGVEAKSPAVRRLMDVDHRGMAEWIAAIPFEEWPQQTRLSDGKIRPAMVNDVGWHGFEDASVEVTARVMLELERRYGTGIYPEDPMLSVVMPGHSIDPHADQQPPGWLTRVHVPLLTNPWAFFDVEGDAQDPGSRRFQMQAGKAYLVDVTRRHGVCNNGQTPRVHFMFDVFEG
jgi:hypothetical protein